MRGDTGRLGTVGSIVAVIAVVAAIVWIGGAMGVLDGDVLEGTTDERPSWMNDLDSTVDGGSGGETGPADVAAVEEQEASVEIERLIHIRVNEIREDRGLEPLDHDAYIADIARAHSADMYDREYFSHYNPEDESPGDRMADGNLFPGHCRTVGENLAHVSFSGELETTENADRIAEVIVEGWMDSPGHRENLLKEGWDRHGIGVYGGPGDIYATQNFCEERF